MITTDVINFESQYSLIIVGPARTEALIPLLREGVPVGRGSGINITAKPYIIIRYTKGCFANTHITTPAFSHPF